MIVTTNSHDNPIEHPIFDGFRQAIPSTNPFNTFQIISIPYLLNLANWFPDITWYYLILLPLNRSKNLPLFLFFFKVASCWDSAAMHRRVVWDTAGTWNFPPVTATFSAWWPRAATCHGIMGGFIPPGSPVEGRNCYTMLQCYTHAFLGEGS